MGRFLLALLGTCFALAPAHAKEQVVPAMFHWAGPYAAGGPAIVAGMLDYLQMRNVRDGGINGVKFAWQKNDAAAGATLVMPLSTGITNSLLERVAADKVPLFPYVFPLITTYWDQAAAMVRYIGEEEGGLEKLRDRKIALLYHDSAYGKEPIPVLADLAKKYGYTLSTIPVPHPGDEQQSQWQQILQLRPDWVILWGWGAMTPTALTSAAKVGYPRGRMLGVWWSGAEEDVVPAGEAAKDFVAAGFNAPGASYPVIAEIRKHVYGKGGGEMQDRSRIGSIHYNRGVVFGIITAEAVRVAQNRFGKIRPVTGAQLQWALEHLNLDARRLKALGASGLMPPLDTSCSDHAGSGVVRFMRWDGSRWNAIGDWVAPLPGDREMVQAKYAESAMRYAKEKGITPRRCSAE
jgi:branched-chain amino acid transport system substrate-binding protein